MSSPVHQPKDLDAALMYAPPWARQAGASSPMTAADPPVESPPTSPGGETDEPPFIGDRAMLHLRRRLSLDPELVPEPPTPFDDRFSVDRIALRLCAVAAVAAAVAWAMVSLTTKPVGDGVSQAGASPPITANPVEPMPAHAATAAPPPEQAMEPQPPQQAMEPTSAFPAVLPGDFQPRSVPSAAVSAQQPRSPPTAATSLALAPDEIAMLVKRGKDQLMNGDISSARLLLRRAAEAGNAEAALALGSTFDPLVIARLSAFGVQANAAKAREWYQKAAELGSKLASEQLARLAGRAR